MTLALQRPAWLYSLLNLWLLRRAAAPRGNPLSTILILTIGLLAAWIGIDRWQRQPDPQWYGGGTTQIAWYVLGTMGLAALLHVATKLRFAAALVLALGVAPLPLLLIGVVAYWVTPAVYFGCAAAVALYEWVFLSRALATFTGKPQRLPALGGILFVIAFIATSAYLDAVPDVWVAADAAAPLGNDGLVEREQALFEQADRIDAGIAAMSRDDATGPLGFFIGFAGVGDQKVFSQEIDLASRTLGDRFKIGTRTLSLINDDRDLQRAPLANINGLRYALRETAARMDRQRDVLFLAISSHGSPGASIAVSVAQMTFADLTGPELADALRESQITWRVIILSACYAGGFIDDLRDSHTIVIAAAAADRSSFGCSNDSDLTYFGEAFYRDALPRAHSLHEAFAAAKEAIADRERQEGVTPSDPQAFFGADIDALLPTIESVPPAPKPLDP